MKNKDSTIPTQSKSLRNVLFTSMIGLGLVAGAVQHTYNGLVSLMGNSQTSKATSQSQGPQEYSPIQTPQRIPKLYNDDPATLEEQMATAHPYEDNMDWEAREDEMAGPLEELASPTKTSKRGIDALKISEGFRATPYKCSAGKPTIAYGHLILPKEKFTKVTRKEGEEILKKDVSWAEDAVEKYIAVPLNQNQYDALVNFTYNVGATALKNSTLRKELEAGDYYDAANELLRWNKAGGKVVKGLTDRRIREREIFLSD